MIRVVMIFVFGCIVSGAFIVEKPVKTYPEKLSAWGIFEGKMSALKPAQGVVPYGLNTPLYTDYAEKLRCIRLPKGQQVAYSADNKLEFPEGTLLVKTFFYPADFKKPGLEKDIVETRLLVKEMDGWKAITYVWNEDQTDAFLEIAGDDRNVNFIDKEGTKQQVRYVVPNQNQCKGCHNADDRIMPIGPVVSQLNGTYAYTTGRQNQLTYWKTHGMLQQLPDISTLPRTAVWNDPATGDLNKRARAYLSINCAHCHRKEGPAQTSGLFLTESETDQIAIGVNKTPVAAGKGSGGRMFDIKPGHAEGSILWYRMQTQDPGERMPELGRSLVHKEGVALIKEWIDSMK